MSSTDNKQENIEIKVDAIPEKEGLHGYHNFSVYIANKLFALSISRLAEDADKLSKLFSASDNQSYGTEAEVKASLEAHKKMFDLWNDGELTVFTPDEIKYIYAGFAFIKAHKREFDRRFLTYVVVMYRSVLSAPGVPALPLHDLPKPLGESHHLY